MLYENGQGVSQSYKKAAKLYRLSAEQGFDRAQFNLGVSYYTGSGVKKSKKEAIKWFRRAAELGNKDAAKNLRVLLK